VCELYACVKPLSVALYKAFEIHTQAHNNQH